MNKAYKFFNYQALKEIQDSNANKNYYFRLTTKKRKILRLWCNKGLITPLPDGRRTKPRACNFGRDGLYYRERSVYSDSVEEERIVINKKFHLLYDISNYYVTLSKDIGGQGPPNITS